MDTDLPAVNEFVTGLNKALSRAKDSLIAAQAHMKKNAYAHRRELEFEIGDQVLLSSKNIKLRTVGTKKLLPRYLGPFEILKKNGRLAYELDLSAAMPKVHPVFHVSLLRPFTPGGTTPPPVPVLIEGEPEWKVERVLNHRDRKIPNAKRSRREYLVKWIGFGHEYNEWKSKADCKGCLDLVQQYLDSIRH
jgi:hypothetical protein